MSERNSGESERSVPPFQPAQQVDPRGAAESGAASGAVNPTTRNPTPIPLPHTQHPALSARSATGTTERRFHSLQAATDQVTLLEQLAANQQDVITTLSDRIVQMSIDMDRISNWMQRHPHHQSSVPSQPALSPAPQQQEPVVQPATSGPPPATRYASVTADPEQVDPEREHRREYMERERDRTATVSPGESQQYFRPHSLGVKLRSFNGKYTENVQAWISIIEDQFVANHTPKDTKVASISGLFKGVAETWYLWLKGEYGRTPSWEELKQELLIKFAQDRKSVV